MIQVSDQKVRIFEDEQHPDVVDESDRKRELAEFVRPVGVNGTREQEVDRRGQQKQNEFDRTSAGIEQHRKQNQNTVPVLCLVGK